MIRTYATPPYKIVLLHGGPGAAGAMEPMAQKLSTTWSCIEPFQTGHTINEQIQELKKTVDNHATLPIILIGFSWGAWLGLLFAAQFPQHVKQLILISSGPFETKYTQYIYDTRKKRMTKKIQEQISIISAQLKNPATRNKNALFTALGTIYTQLDAKHYDATGASHYTFCDFDIYKQIWPAAEKLRQNDQLIAAAKTITCPVIALHGDFDPHPAEGVQKPLNHVLQKFKFILLPNCGHTPWVEKHAHSLFYNHLFNEIKTAYGT